MRELRAVEQTQETLDLGPETNVPLANAVDLDQQIRTVRREQKLASVAVMMLDAAKILEPIVGMLSGHLLRWAALASTVGLTGYALREPTWERAAIVAGFAVVAPWIIRRGSS